MAIPNIKSLLTVFSNLSKKERVIFAVACTCVILVLVDRGVVNPILQKLGSLKEEIHKKEDEAKKNLHIVSQKERILGEVQKLSSFFSAGASEEEITTIFLKEVESLANKSSLSILDMKPAGIKTSKDQAKKCLINLSCEGQMEQIMDFMYNVENSQSLLSVERYQISPKGREGSVAVSTMTIAKILLE